MKNLFNEESLLWPETAGQRWTNMVKHFKFGCFESIFMIVFEQINSLA